MACRTISTIICGDDFTVSLSEDGKIYTFGNNKNKQLGHKRRRIISIPTVILSRDIKSISCGKNHTICLNFIGDVFSFGNNKYGQLGIKPIQAKNKQNTWCTHIPQKINLPPIKQVSCGASFTICVSENGDMYSFGKNTNAQLALGDYKQSHILPQKIETLKDVDFVECALKSSYCKTFSNQIYLLICDPILQSNCPNNIVDIKCGSYHTLLLTADGDVYSKGENVYNQLGRDLKQENRYSFKKIPSLSGITRIECGKYHSMCIDFDNNLYVFGKNYSGQLGLKKYCSYQLMKHPSLSNIIDISKGGNHTFVKTSNNEIYAFGKNGNSQLGFKKKPDSFYLKPQINQVFQGTEFIWSSNITKKPKAKSARTKIK